VSIYSPPEPSEFDAFAICRGYPETGIDDDGERGKPKVTIRETLGEDGNVVAKVQNLTSNVVGKMGGMLGKGIGGISGKFGGPGSWF
jgi:hypothetical protein